MSDIVDLLRLAIGRAEERAGTIPAKEAVKLRPADWHSVTTRWREAVAEIIRLRKELAEARNTAREIAYVIDESGVTHRQFTVVYREDALSEGMDGK